MKNIQYISNSITNHFFSFNLFPVGNNPTDFEVTFPSNQKLVYVTWSL